MKKLVLTLLLGVTTLTAFSQVPSYVPTSGLVGYWPFNGNAQDESGNVNHGTINGASPTNDRNGVANKAYSFNGSTDYIGIPLINLSLSNSMTISAWINTSNITSNLHYHIMRQDDGSSGGGVDWLLAFQNHGTTLSFGITSGGVYSELDLPINSINYTNKWINIIAVYDGIKRYIYVNGILIGSDSKSGNLKYTSTATFAFGASWANINAAEKFNGKIDDIGIWNRALTQQEITALNTSCSTPTATITPQSTTFFCQGGSVILNASTGTGYTYEWYKDGNIINGSTTSSYTANQSGSYTVKIINGSCNATSSVTDVLVNTNPTVSLSLDNLIYLKASPVTLAGSPSGGSYSGAGVVGNTFSSTNAGLGKKTITYNYTSGAGCSGSATAITTVYDTTACSTFDTLFINIAVAGLAAPNNLGTLKIWPNPANDQITIDNGNFSILNGYSVKIETVLGQEVFKSVINQKQFSVDLSTWKGKGVYLVHVLDGQNNIIESKKIILQ